MRISECSSVVCSTVLDNDTVQIGGQAGIDDRNDMHDVTIGPPLPDLDVQPFAEERVGKAQNDGNRDNSSAVYLWPGRPSDQKESEHDRGQGDQNVAARAMQRGNGELRGGARFPEGLERQVGQIGSAS